MYINPEHKERLKKITAGGVIGIVLYSLYLFAQIMGWIPSQENKEVEKPVAAEQQQVSQQAVGK